MTNLIRRESVFLGVWENNLNAKIIKQESISVGCVPPACQPYVFRWLPLRTGGKGEGEVSWNEQVWTGFWWWPPAVSSRGWVSWNDQVWTGLQWWPPDFSSGKGEGMGILGPMSRGGGGYHRSHIQVVRYILPCDLSHDAFDVTYHPFWTEWQTPVKTLPSRNYCCGWQQRRIPKLKFLGSVYIKTQSLTKEPFVFLRFFGERKRIGKKRGCVFIIINIETSSRWRFHGTKMVL